MRNSRDIEDRFVLVRCPNAPRSDLDSRGKCCGLLTGPRATGEPFRRHNRPRDQQPATAAPRRRSCGLLISRAIVPAERFSCSSRTREQTTAFTSRVEIAAWSVRAAYKYETIFDVSGVSHILSASASIISP